MVSAVMAILHGDLTRSLAPEQCSVVRHLDVRREMQVKERAHGTYTITPLTLLYLGITRPEFCYFLMHHIDKKIYNFHQIDVIFEAREMIPSPFLIV